MKWFKLKKVVFPILIIMLLPLLVIIDNPFKNLTNEVLAEKLGEKVQQEILILSFPFLIIISIIIAMLILRHINKEKYFANGESHGFDMSYIWFFIASKILGYGKCDLQLVPIPLQYKLVIKQSFEMITVQSDQFYPQIEDERIEVTKCNISNTSIKVLNLVISDTYMLEDNNLPEWSKDFPTVKISRTTGNNRRSISQEFLNSVQETVNLERNNYSTINLFATTNPKHNLIIADSCFKTGNRCMLKRINVYYSNQNDYKFSDKKIEITLW